MSDILDQPDSTSETTRNASRQTYQVPGAPASYERISTAFSGAQLHSVIVHEPPGHRAEPISHEGEEIIFMLSGPLTIEVDGHVEVLRQGNSLHFDSRRVHALWNHIDTTASILWCGTMDVFGGPTGPIHKDQSKVGAT
ncbi:cupin domain-containing protein [Ascidiaceihabitans sp.]|uniref:cupin domain-containing protein n=1 Tax=Ascidiaceihabitans sp. TaxID=1872644 RepID=UPI003299D496